MRTFRWYGPALVLLLVALVVVLAGPGIARRLAYENRLQEISLIKDGLRENVSLAELSRSFKDVARVVEPSVVYIQVFKRGSSATPQRRMLEEDFFRRFFGPRGLPPELVPPGGEDGMEEQTPQDDEPSSRQRDGGNMDRYNVPRQVGSGSGWIYSNDGYIITNNHVIEEADRIEVRFYNGETLTATVKGTDPKTDVAVLKVDAAKLHAATLATEPVDQGEIVFAFGAPFRFEFSMSQGIVSGKGRQLGILAGRQGYENFIQTDAAINPGNSGGPLTNIYGQVVGMNTAIATQTGAFNGLGFAIPVDMVKRVVDELIATGKVQRGYLGIFIEELDPRMARTFGYDGKGVLVTNPIEGGPAAEAGVQRGDIITKVDGKAVSNPDELRNLVADLPPGKQVRLEIYRNGQISEKVATIAVLPDQVAMTGERSGMGERRNPETVSRELLNKLGFENVATMGRELAERFRVPFVEGVVVMNVRPNSAAAAERITRGSVITDVMGVKVTSVEQLVGELNKHDLRKGVRMSLRSGEVERFVLLELPTD